MEQMPHEKRYTGTRLASLAKQYNRFLADGQKLAAEIPDTENDAIRKKDMEAAPFEEEADRIVCEVLDDFTAPVLPETTRKIAIRLGLAAGIKTGAAYDSLRAAADAASLAPLGALHKGFEASVGEYVKDRTFCLLLQALGNHPFAQIAGADNAGDMCNWSKKNLENAMKQVLPDAPAIHAGILRELDKDIARGFRQQFAAQTDLKPQRIIGK